MKLRTRRLGVVLAAGAVAAFALVTNGAAHAADPYSPSITSDVHAVSAGGRVAASASSDIACTSWTATAVDFSGGTKNLGGGKTASVTFSAPDEPGTYHIRFVCTYDDGQATNSSLGTEPGRIIIGVAPTEAPVVTLAALQTQSTTVAFVIAGSSDDDDDDSDDSDDSDDEGSGSSGNRSLPDTGGPRQELLWTGLMFVAAGSAAVYTVRRRNINNA